MATARKKPSTRRNPPASTKKKTSSARGGRVTEKNKRMANMLGQMLEGLSRLGIDDVFGRTKGH